MTALDHLVYGAPDLAAAIEELEARLGVRAAAGGRHPAWGTHNALLALGEGRYLEIMAPDPARPTADRAPPLGLARLERPRLVGWAARAPDLNAVVARASELGVELGPLLPGGRRRPDGTELTWILTDPHCDRMGGTVPFFIDWGASPHPSATAPAGCSLLGFAAEHPDAARAGAVLRALDLDLVVAPGPAPRLIATLGSPRGVVELR